MRIRRWVDEEERQARDMGPSATIDVIVMLGLILLACWIVSRPTTPVQNVDRWPEPVAAEVGR